MADKRIDDDKKQNMADQSKDDKKQNIADQSKDHDKKQNIADQSKDDDKKRKRTSDKKFLCPAPVVLRDYYPQGIEIGALCIERVLNPVAGLPPTSRSNEETSEVETSPRPGPSTSYQQCMLVGTVTPPTSRSNEETSEVEASPRPGPSAFRRSYSFVSPILNGLFCCSREDSTIESDNNSVNSQQRYDPPPVRSWHVISPFIAPVISPVISPKLSPYSTLRNRVALQCIPGRVEDRTINYYPLLDYRFSDELIERTRSLPDILTANESDQENITPSPLVNAVKVPTADSNSSAQNSSQKKD